MFTVELGSVPRYFDCFYSVFWEAVLGPEAQRVFLVVAGGLLLQSTGSRGLRLSSSGAQLSYSMWDFSSLPRDRTQKEGWILNRWAAGEVLLDFLGTDD